MTLQLVHETFQESPGTLGETYLINMRIYLQYVFINTQKMMHRDSHSS